MDVKTRIMIDKITEYVRKEYKIIGPISDIESIVVSMGGIIVEKTAIDDLSDIWIRKSGKESFEIFLPPVQISWTIERRNFMIAHELGHSMHSYYSNKEQNVINADYTIMVAEVASTVNEILLSDYQIKTEKDNKKKAELIYELLEMIRATFFRQAMFAEFEKIVHEKIENSVMLSADDLNDIYYKLNQKYFGNDIVIDEQIKYEWARIPHFYSDFYVYQYATGYAAASAFANSILNGEKDAVEKYIGFLKSGGSDYPIEILKKAGVDMTTSKPLESTINRFNELLDMLEKEI